MPAPESGLTTGVRTPSETRTTEPTRRALQKPMTLLVTGVTGTSVQAPAQHVPLADASWEVGSGSGYLSAGSAALNLGPTAVAKL